MKQVLNMVFWMLVLSIHVLWGQEKKTVIIDAGHGGIDSGAIGINGLKEKKAVLTIAQRIAALNKTVFDGRHAIYLTRYTDTLISLGHRTQLARALKPTMFISLHANHAPAQKATGIEIYIHRETPFSEPNQKESYRIATSVLKELTDEIGYKNRGVKTANFQVLRETVQTCPAILVEFGFLSNRDEAAYLGKETSISALALAILMAVNR